MASIKPITPEPIKHIRSHTFMAIFRLAKVKDTFVNPTGGEGAPSILYLTLTINGFTVILYPKGEI